MAAEEVNSSGAQDRNGASEPENSSSGGAPFSSGSEGTQPGQGNKDSCTPKFDALWFCYSPGYQLQQYYIHGRVDDCSSKWTDLIDCLKRRTKYRDEVLQAEAAKKHPLWDIRTHQEAQDFWQREFGHLSGEGVRQPGDEVNGMQHSGQPTLV